MRLFLFLDDWMLDDYRDVVRRFPRPVEAPVPYWEDAHNHSSVIFDPDAGTYRCWYRRFYVADGSTDSRAALCLAESTDGYHWQPVVHNGPTDPAVPDRRNALLVPERPDGSGTARVHAIFRDEHESDPSRRYKGVDYYGWLLVSPDGAHWRTDPGLRAFTIKTGSDTQNGLFWNPVTERYQIHHRPVNVDRRVAMTESPDFLNWTPRGVVFQTDAQDLPHLEIYGMPAFWYEDLFIAFPWLYRVPAGETGRRWKMFGHLETGFAYSYNGTYWLRPYREPFIPLTEPGSYGGGGITLNHFVLGEDDVPRLYGIGSKPQHDRGTLWQGYVERGEEFGAMLMHTMRKDGFAFLEPMGGWGWLKTKTILPQDADLTLNLQAPVGQVLFQLSDEASDPIPGFTFDDCLPFVGDGVAVRPRWREHQIDELVGRPCRVEVKLFSARIYAMRWQSQVYYGKEPQDRI